MPFGLNSFCCPGAKVGGRLFAILTWMIFWSGPLLQLVLCDGPALAALAEPAVLEHIALDSTSSNLEVRFSQKPHFKLVKMDRREVLLAFRNVVMAPDVTGWKNGVPSVHKLRIENLPDHVVSLTIQTKADVIALRPRWFKSRRTLSVLIQTRAETSAPSQIHPPSAGKGPEGERSAPKINASDLSPLASNHEKAPHESMPTRPQQLQAEAPLQKGSQTPPASVQKNAYSGTMADLLIELQSDPCSAQPSLQSALRLARAKQWQEVIELLRPHLNVQASFSNQDACQVAQFFLGAYAHFEAYRDDSTSPGFEADQLFQEATSYYPGARYTPYAMAAFGFRNMSMQNTSVASGYFKMLLKQYPDYPGMPEALLSLGKLSLDKKAYKDAIAYFEHGLKINPHSQVSTMLTLELGKALFGDHQFQRSIQILTHLMEDKPRQVYATPDLLVYLGNGYYQMGRLKEALDPLSKAFNLFEDLPERAVVLTRIGDAYLDLGQRSKAKQIYQLIADRFPETDGYMVSIVRLAELAESDAEKETIFKKIIDEFPENSMAGLARLKLANIHRRHGRLLDSIEMAKPLLNNSSQELRQNAYYLMHKAYHRWLQERLAAGDIPSILVRYEQDRHLFKKIDQPDLFLLVAEAYLHTHLHASAADLLKRAYDLTPNRKRSAQLLYKLGLALHETGRDEDALSKFYEYATAFAQDRNAAEARYRIGRILMQQERSQDAIIHLDAAYALSQSEGQRGTIKLAAAEVHRALGQPRQTLKCLVKAINHLAEVPGERRPDLFTAYRQLGDCYVQLQVYLKAADAFTMALKLADQSQGHLDIRYSLGEAFRKAKAHVKAQNIFQEIAANDQGLWGKLAQEGLRSLQLGVNL